MRKSLSIILFFKAFPLMLRGGILPTSRSFRFLGGVVDCFSEKASTNKKERCVMFCVSHIPHGDREACRAKKGRDDVSTCAT